MADGGSPSSRKPKLSTGAVARHHSNDESPSLYGTMCDRVALLTHKSVRCRLCKESPGVKVLDAAELADRANRLREANLRISQAEDDRKADPFDKRARDALEHAEAAKRRLLEQLGEETTCKPCRGTGYTTPTRSHRAGKERPDMFVTRRCSKCWGCGEPVGEVVTVQANTGHRKTYRFARLLPTDQTAEREDRCTRCGGDAYTIPVTAKPTGSSKGSDQLAGSGASTKTDAGGAAYSDTEIVTALDEDALALELDQAEALEDLDPEIATAATLLHAPDAERWAAHRWGRSFVLWAVVDAGKALAEEAAARSRLGSGHLVPVLERLAAEREAEAKATRPDYRRRSLIAAAHRQARELHTRVQDALRSRGIAA
jgi:hypothetical protein